MSAGYLAKCSGPNGLPKKRHETQAEAEKQRAHLISIGRYTRANSNTYECNVCWHWHVGRATGTQFRGRAKGAGYRKGRSHSHRKGWRK